MTKALRKREPRFIEVQRGDELVLRSEDGLWHPELAVKYVMDNAHRMISVPELARTFYHAPVPINKEKIRRRLPSLFNRLLDLGLVMVTEYDPNSGRATAVKIYDPTSQQDQQNILAKLSRMQISADKFVTVQKLIGLTDEPEHSAA